MAGRSLAMELDAGRFIGSFDKWPAYRAPLCIAASEMKVRTDLSQLGSLGSTLRSELSVDGAGHRWEYFLAWQTARGGGSVCTES